jgi:8-amino-7-oxononanoate synthase
MTQLQELAAALQRAEQQQLRRQRRTVQAVDGPCLQVAGREQLAFCSNDYLGLARHPHLVDVARAAVQHWGVGGMASHLISGHTEQHARTEAALAEWVGMPAALLCSTGYMANMAVITSLVGRGDTVLADKLNHASLNDAMVLSRATLRRYAHNDLDHLQYQLARSRGRKLIAVDGVFSMDGDLAPLPELLRLADAHDAWLLVDDAHGFGVLAQGRGSLRHWGVSGERLIYMGTLGKAAGVAGAFVAAHATVTDWLVQQGRSYIYTTATPAAQAATVAASLHIMRTEPQRFERLAAHIDTLRAGCAGLPWELLPSGTPIQPLLTGDNATTLALSRHLWQAGVWVPAIRPPTVPAGRARLRITLSASHTRDQIDRLLHTLHAAARALTA